MGLWHLLVGDLLQSVHSLLKVKDGRRCRANSLVAIARLWLQPLATPLVPKLCRAFEGTGILLLLPTFFGLVH